MLSKYISGALAGIEIGFGALFMLAARSQGYSPIVGAVCFSVGLYMVFSTNAGLFTGKCFGLYDVLTNSLDFSDWLRELGYSIVGNPIGAIFLIGLLHYTGIAFEALPAIAGMKLALSAEEMIARSVLCNILICLAVYINRTTKNSALAVLTTVPIFIACGFEHSVANMTILLLAKGLTIEVVASIFCSIVGNFIGGALISLLLYAKNREKRPFAPESSQEPF